MVLSNNSLPKKTLDTVLNRHNIKGQLIIERIVHAWK